MNYTITSDPVDQYQGRGVQGRYDSTFEQMTPAKNCIVFDDHKDMERVSQAMERWAKNNLRGAKVRTTKAYKADGKPRCWLVFPPVAPVPKTEIRGNFPK